MPSEIKYCPRCARPYSGATAGEALRKMTVHVKKAHPEYYQVHFVN